jgi:hypothetical protein
MGGGGWGQLQTNQEGRAQGVTFQIGRRHLHRVLPFEWKHARRVKAPVTLAFDFPDAGKGALEHARCWREMVAGNNGGK